MDWFQYVATIHTRQEDRDGAWQAWLVREFEEIGMPFFGSDGTLREHGPQRPSGRYEFLDAPPPDEPPSPWMRPSPCPYVGPIAGFVTWEWWTTEIAQREPLARSLLMAGRGCMARTDGRGGVFEAVVEEAFPLADFAHSHGFHDGDFFWSEPSYTSSVRGRLVRAVEKIGLEPELFTGGTSHNPHRISQFVPRRGQSFASCWETFRAHEADPVTLWGYNITGMKTAAFHALLADD